MQAAVDQIVQLPMSEQAHQDLANLALGPRRLEQADQQHQGDEPAQRAPNLRDDECEVYFSASMTQKLSGSG